MPALPGEILIFGITPSQFAKELAEYRVAQAVLNLEYAKELSAAAQAAGVCVEGHLKLDTGMGRIGFVAGRPSGSIPVLLEACRLPGAADYRSIFTFFFFGRYFRRGDCLYPGAVPPFRETLDGLAAAGKPVPFAHMQNSAGIVSYPEYQFDGARAGVILYGQPLDFLPGHDISLKPVMSLRSTVAMVKEVSPGDCISYSRTFRAEHPCGLPPSLSDTPTAICGLFPTRQM